MKKIILLTLISAFFLSFSPAKAQKFGYIDSEYITSKMPTYKQVQVDMDALADKWLKEIKEKNNQLDDFIRKYQTEEILLTDEMKRERQIQIKTKEDELQKLNHDVFGMEGLLFQKKKDLLKPIQDTIFKAVEKISRKRQLMFMFDKSADMTMIYTDPRHDYTDYVMEELGLTDERNKADATKKSSF